MKPRQFATLLALCSAPLMAQTPAPAPTAAPAAQQTHSSNLGFSYSLPSDWTVKESEPNLSAIRQKAENDATSEDERTGAACAQLAFTGSHGDPPSVLVVVGLPFDCFGQTMTDKDLPSFGDGAAEGLKKSFVLTDSVNGTYTLGSHSLWIERANGSIIDQPDIKRTLEVVCTILKKGAVCWLAMVNGDADLQAFEHGQVRLENDAPAALVPANAFSKKPSQ